MSRSEGHSPVPPFREGEVKFVAGMHVAYLRADANAPTPYGVELPGASRPRTPARGVSARGLVLVPFG